MGRGYDHHAERRRNDAEAESAAALSDLTVVIAVLLGTTLIHGAMLVAMDVSGAVVIVSQRKAM
jgi:hypothetical protein